MTPYDDRRVLTIETPVGAVCNEVKKWNEGEDDEHWSYVQKLTVDMEDSSPNGQIVGEFLKQYTVAYELSLRGYHFHSVLDDTSLLWTKSED